MIHCFSISVGWRIVSTMVKQLFIRYLISIFGWILRLFSSFASFVDIWVKVFLLSFYSCFYRTLLCFVWFEIMIDLLEGDISLPAFSFLVICDSGYFWLAGNIYGSCVFQHAGHVMFVFVVAKCPVIESSCFRPFWVLEYIRRNKDAWIDHHLRRWIHFQKFINSKNQY